MILPPPTAPNIDVDVERLRDVERKYQEAPKDVGIAKGFLAGIQTADAAAAAIAKMDERRRAVEMQKLLDTGWDGYAQAWEAAGKPPEVRPDVLKPLGSQGLLAGWQGLAERQVKEEGKKAVTAYEDIVTKGVMGADGKYRPATQAEIDAASVAAGKAAGKGYDAVQKVEDRKSGERKAEAKITAQKDLASAKEEFTREMKQLDRAVEWARVNKAVPKGFYAQLKRDVDELAKLQAEETAFDPTSESAVLDPNRINHIRVQIRSLKERIARAGYKEGEGSADPQGGGGADEKKPKEGDTKTNSSGDKLIFKGGKWQLAG